MSRAERPPAGPGGAVRAKALVISRNLPPIHGGIERLMLKALEALCREYDCHVIGPRGCRAFVPPQCRVCELPAGLPWFHGLALLTALLWRLQHRYALCAAGNGLVGPVAAFAAALSRCPWIVFVHGLDLVAGHRFYQALFVPLLRRARVVVANSRYTGRLAERSGIQASRIRVVPPGVAPAASARPDPRRTRGPVDGPVLLSVGRLVARKGFAEFIERVLPRVVERYPGVRYLIVGAEPDLAAGQAGGTREQILASARRAGASERVQLVGALAQQELEGAYASADVLIFPSISRAGDAEGFGMVILEAAAHGVPTVAFDTGGVADAMSQDNGILVADADYESYAQAVLALLAGTPRVTRASCREHASRFSWERFAEGVREAASRA